MKKANELQYAILGLGVFGSTIAKTLSSYDCEVIAIDRESDCVHRLADIVTLGVRGDITDINVLRNAGVADCDVAIIAVGTHLEESLMAVLNAKELGVPKIIAKAKNKRYKEILLRVGADKVVRPEKEMGVVTAKSLLNKNIVEMIDLDKEYSVAEILAPSEWVGKTLQELDVRSRLEINVVGVRYCDGRLDVTPNPFAPIDAQDHIVVIAHSSKFDELDFS
ncbi:MAG: potassium channel family protein [Breznakia sp.]